MFHLSPLALNLLLKAGEEGAPLEVDPLCQQPAGDSPGDNVLISSQATTAWETSLLPNRSAALREDGHNSLLSAHGSCAPGQGVPADAGAMHTPG